MHASISSNLCTGLSSFPAIYPSICPAIHPFSCPPSLKYLPIRSLASLPCIHSIPLASSLQPSFQRAYTLVHLIPSRALASFSSLQSGLSPRQLHFARPSEVNTGLSRSLQQVPQMAQQSGCVTQHFDITECSVSQYHGITGCMCV